MEGTVAGDGLLLAYEASLQKCKEDCNNNNNCNSFGYSQIASKQCKLMTEVAPTMPNYSPYQDFQFCARKKNVTRTDFISGK